MGIPVISDFFDSALGQTVGKLIDKGLAFIPDPVQRAQAEKEMRDQAMQIALAQIEATKSDSWNMKGRALLLFGGAGGIVYQLVLHPMLVAVLLATNPNFPVERIPALDLKSLLSLVMGLLGLGG